MKKELANRADVKAAVDELAQATKKSFDHIEAKMATKDDLKDFATKDDLKKLATKEDFKTILAVVTSIDRELKEHKTHPARIQRLERAVFPR